MHKGDTKPEYVKKSKIAHNFFMTKATVLKTIFLKSPWKISVETYVSLILIFVLNQKKYFLHFFDLFIAFLFDPP